VPGSSTTSPTVPGSSTTASISPQTSTVPGGGTGGIGGIGGSGGQSGMAATGTGTTSGTLPRTGQGLSVPLAALGGALVLAGIALLATTKQFGLRRRTEG
jgi:hypothetical protein